MNNYTLHITEKERTLLHNLVSNKVHSSIELLELRDKLKKRPVHANNEKFQIELECNNFFDPEFQLEIKNHNLTATERDDKVYLFTGELSALLVFILTEYHPDATPSEVQDYYNSIVPCEQTTPGTSGS